MIKFRFYLDFDREEAWLNNMARNGFELVNTGFWYTFQRCEPFTAVYRIDHRMFNSRKEFHNYCTLFEDSGWQHVAGGWNSGTQYFRQINPSAGAEIFSDDYSKAGRFKRMADLWLNLALVMFTVMIALWMTGAVDLAALIQPSRLYLTPGLWERSGVAFWRAFQFETPFAVLRLGGLLFYPFALLVYGYFALQSWRLYKKGKDHVH